MIVRLVGYVEDVRDGVAYVSYRNPENGKRYTSAKPVTDYPWDIETDHPVDFEIDTETHESKTTQRPVRPITAEEFKEFEKKYGLEELFDDDQGDQQVDGPEVRQPP